MADYKTKNAFTLIEVSIVLVIIGLMVGGVLVGRDLIKASEIRSVIRQQEQFATAAHTFRTKYNCMPGDCGRASDFGAAISSNGNGDGEIGCHGPNKGTCSRTAGGAQDSELINFWYHLSQEKLIPETFLPYDSSDTYQLAGVVSPASRLSGGVNVSGDDVANHFGWAIIPSPLVWDVPLCAGTCRTAPGYHFMLAQYAVLLDKNGFAMYRPADMAAIDTKLDDSLPMTGRVRGWVWNVNDLATENMLLYPNHGVASANRCINSGVTPPQYNVRYTGDSFPGLCSVLIQASF